MTDVKSTKFLSLDSKRWENFINCQSLYLKSKVCSTHPLSSVSVPLSRVVLINSLEFDISFILLNSEIIEQQLTWKMMHNIETEQILLLYTFRNIIYIRYSLDYFPVYWFILSHLARSLFVLYNQLQLLHHISFAWEIIQVVTEVGCWPRPDKYCFSCSIRLLILDKHCE